MNACLDDLLEAWEINNEINLFILRWIPPEGLKAVTLLKTGEPSWGRNVARIFAHMHEPRCSKLEQNTGAAGDLPRFEGFESPDAGRLGQARRSSGRASDLRRRCPILTNVFSRAAWQLGLGGLLGCLLGGALLLRSGRTGREVAIFLGEALREE